MKHIKLFENFPAKKFTDAELEKIKSDVQGSNFPAEYEVKFSNGSYVIEVTVDNDKAKGFFEKYIAKNKGEYIQKAVDLARNKEELHFLHETIRSKMETISLGNPELFTRSLEEAYQQMKEKYV